MESSHHWSPPLGGPHQVAVNVRVYEARTEEIENFFGRRLARYSHIFSHDGHSYQVFCFPDPAEAAAFAAAFDGEPFDPRDRGSGAKWMMWFKGRAARRRRSPYDFR
jgi:hypothetical protein